MEKSNKTNLINNNDDNNQDNNVNPNVSADLKVVTDTKLANIKQPRQEGQNEEKPNVKKSRPDDNLE